MWMAKLGGALLIILFGGMMGFSYCEDMRNRISLLQEFQKGILSLYQEMNCRKEPLGEAAVHAGAILTGPVAQFFQSLGKTLEELPGVSFLHIWEEKMHQYLDPAPLSGKDRQLIGQLGRQLDALQNEEVSGIWRIYDSRLEEALTEAKETYRSKAQLYGRLGILGGLFLIILLI